MDNIRFTDDQAAHACGVVLKLMKVRRFFLRKTDQSNPLFGLDPQVFGQALELDQAIRIAYTGIQRSAEAQIVVAERKFGIAGPDLGKDEKLVRCELRTGGLDICQVYPLTAFAPYVPESFETLTEECLQQLLGGKAEGDISPNAMQSYHESARQVAEKVWEQLQALDAKSLANPRCVVVMETEFTCQNTDQNRDLMQSKTKDMQQFPHALGYLFLRRSKEERIVANNHVVFNTRSTSHVNVWHWKGSEPGISYHTNTTYHCPLVFATVL